MKHKIILFWLLVFGVLFAFLQIDFRYHFFYIEQSQLFQATWPYVAGRLALPGGAARVLSEYLVQFFIVPYVGPGIIAALLTLAGICTGIVVRKIAPASNLFVFCLLPVVALLFIHFDFNYLVCGTVAYAILLLFFCLYVNKRKAGGRLALGFVLTPLLFALAGPVAVLFALLVTFYEVLNKTPKGYLAALTCVEVLLLGIASVYFSIAGEYRFVFLPDGYYHKNLEPKSEIWFSWISLLLVVFLAFLLRARKGIIGKKRKIGEGIVQVVLVAAFCGWGISRYADKKSYRLKKLDYFARTSQWDQTVDACRGQLTNFLYLCHLNMALAERGELADKLFHFDQRGVQGIMVPWNKTENISCLLSDVYFAMGHVAKAQEMAFEAFLCVMGDGNPRMLKRLVQTNLIYGAYPVAEKYIRVLETTFGYSDWAKSQRKFLYDDRAVEKDPLLGAKRKGLPEDSNLSEINGWHADLLTFAQSNPANKAPIEYVGAMYLLAKDMDGFQRLVEAYYGTAVLPVLPISFQEAIITLSEKDPDYWKRFHISEAIRNRFLDYKQQVLANRNNSAALPGLLRRAYGDTYWFYFMFK